MNKPQTAFDAAELTTPAAAARPQLLKPQLSPDDADRARAIMVTHGVVASARLLGVSRQALLAALAGARVHNGTISIIGERLRSLKDAG